MYKVIHKPILYPDILGMTLREMDNFGIWKYCHSSNDDYYYALYFVKNPVIIIEDLDKTDFINQVGCKVCNTERATGHLLDFPEISNYTKAGCHFSGNTKYNFADIVEQTEIKLGKKLILVKATEAWIHVTDQDDKNYYITWRNCD